MRIRAVIVAMFLSLGATQASAQATVFEGIEVEYMTPGYVYYRPLVFNAAPGPLHEFIFGLVGECGGFDDDDFDDIVWNIAGFMMIERTGQEIYGYWATLKDGRPTIWIKMDLWNNPELLSHELLHHRSRGTYNADLSRACTIGFTGIPTIVEIR